jgi:hypothetical protein
MGNASIIIVLGIIATACILGWWVLNSGSDESKGENPTGALTYTNETLYLNVSAYSVNRMGKDYWKDSWNPGGTQGMWDASKEVNDRYETLWKNLFIRKNKITEDYFNEHFSVLDTGVSTDQSYWLSLGTRGEQVKTRGREYYNIMYKVSVDWAQFSNIDYFVIRDNNSEAYFTSDEVEENAFIPEEVEKYPRKRSQISQFLQVDKLKENFFEAAQSLRELDEPMTQYIEPQYIYLNNNGEISIYGSGCADYKANIGVEGFYNVNTGKGSSNQKYCRIV